MTDTETARINLSWLIKLRWGASAGQIVTILVVHRAMGIALPLLPLASLVAVGLATNVAAAWYVRRHPAREGTIGLLLALDVILLTALLYFSGGPNNPFSFLYLVHVALATVVLSPRRAWSIVALAALGFAALFIHHVDLELTHAEHMVLHIRGMWVAFGVAAVFIVTFVTRVTRELTRARVVAQRNEKLASLATLATGAAHELATPLSTIAVVARELERGLDGAPLADVHLIRSEVDRCREILHHLAADAGETTGEGFSSLRARELLEAAQSGLGAGAPIRVDADGAATTELYLPARAAAQALRGVLKNAQQASPAGAVVDLYARRRADGALEITVEDHGPGMPAEVAARAGEPFYTTKPPGEGMGLGLFLTRVVLERIGGSIAVHSVPGRGTRVVLTVPAATNRRIPGAPVVGQGEL